jgi:hypothetical protein
MLAAEASMLDARRVEPVESSLGPWAPADPREVADLLSALETTWWIAGGWAIEMAVGQAFRPHDDIDILVRHDTLPAVREVLSGWDLYVADPPGTLRPWKPRETLAADVQDIWCRPRPGSPWRIQIMVDHAPTPGMWEFRHDPRITRPIESIAASTDDGIPYLVPDVQLLHKATDPRPKDDMDFTKTVPILTTAQKRWLADAIRQTHGGHHPWIQALVD